MQLDRPPLFDRLRDARVVLLAGAGGGYDVCCALPLFFALEAQGKCVHLANLSFSNLAEAEGRRLVPTMLEVTADTDGSDLYFPEKFLCRWFRAEGREVSIHGFEKTGVRPLVAAYRALVDDLGVDTIVLVDGPPHRNRSRCSCVSLPLRLRRARAMTRIRQISSIHDLPILQALSQFLSRHDDATRDVFPPGHGTDEKRNGAADVTALVAVSVSASRHLRACPRPLATR